MTGFSTLVVSFLFSWLLRLSSTTSASDTTTTNPIHELKAEWTTPLKVGDAVPNVTFNTRVRIESDEENPFDWKSKRLFL